MPKVKIKLDEVRVLDESNEWSESDEPYFIIFAFNRATVDKFGVPLHKTTKHAWGDADEGELLTTQTRDEVPIEQQPVIEALRGFSEYCWGPDGEPVDVKNADDLVILVGAMEHDAGTVDEAWKTARLLMSDSLITQFEPDLARSELVSLLAHSMERALNLARIKRGEWDERVGKVQELRFTSADLAKAASSRVRRNVTIDGGDPEGAYRLGFDMMPG